MTPADPFADPLVHGVAVWTVLMLVYLVILFVIRNRNDHIAS